MAYAMGRMTNIWGENAEEFWPERWLDAGGVFRSESPFKFTAFHVGLLFLFSFIFSRLYRTFFPP